MAVVTRMTVAELRERLARFPAWLDVTIVTPDGVHHDVAVMDRWVPMLRVILSCAWNPVSEA